MQTLNGGCLCGDVRYTVNAEVIYSGKCYCSSCRRHSGSGHTATFAVPTDTLSVTGQLTEYLRLGGSSEPVIRRFCRTCGTSVTGSANAAPGITFIVATTLDDPEQYVPQMSVFAAEAVSWDRPSADIPAFPRMPPRA
jgi:hypothetical protein